MRTPPGLARRSLLARERLSRSARWVTVQLLMITTSAGSDEETISNPPEAVSLLADGRIGARVAKPHFDGSTKLPRRGGTGYEREAPDPGGYRERFVFRAQDDCGLFGVG